MTIFMVYTILLTHFQIWNYIRYLVWLIIQINVWNGFYVLSQFTMLVIFHFKVIVYWNFNLPHTYGQCFEKTQFVKWKLSNFSYGSQTWFKVCEIDPRNFI
jgi:hypothetical protein